MIATEEFTIQRPNFYRASWSTLLRVCTRRSKEWRSAHRYACAAGCAAGCAAQPRAWVGPCVPVGREPPSRRRKRAPPHRGSLQLGRWSWCGCLHAQEQAESAGLGGALARAQRRRGTCSLRALSRGVSGLLCSAAAAQNAADAPRRRCRCVSPRPRSRLFVSVSLAA